MALRPHGLICLHLFLIACISSACLFLFSVHLTKATSKWVSGDPFSPECIKGAEQEEGATANSVDVCLCSPSTNAAALLMTGSELEEYTAHLMISAFFSTEQYPLCICGYSVSSIHYSFIC